MIHEAISKVVLRQDLSESEMIGVMTEISEGRATQAQIGALLVALRMKGECVDEIAGAARVLREKSLPVPITARPEILADIVGTGGDGLNTFNVSTTSAFVASACGLAVAKHGNRAASSQCGSADVLEALGVNINLAPEDLGLCLEWVGLAFLFAPSLHPAMRHAMNPRREIKLKSIFNLIGPLTNPARANVQVVGVYQPELTEPLAEVLGRLGSRGAFVVCGRDGCDEITVTGPTRVTRLTGGRIETSTIAPEDFGFRRAGAKDIRGGDAVHNAAVTVDILRGRPSPRRDMVLMNTAALLTAAGLADDMHAGVRQAAEAIDSGRALDKLHALVEATSRLGQARSASGASK